MSLSWSNVHLNLCGSYCLKLFSLGLPTISLFFLPLGLPNRTLSTSVLDPDLSVLRPPGSRSVIILYRYASGSFHHQAKKEKHCFPTVSWLFHEELKSRSVILWYGSAEWGSRTLIRSSSFVVGVFFRVSQLSSSVSFLMVKYWNKKSQGLAWAVVFKPFYVSLPGKVMRK